MRICTRDSGKTESHACGSKTIETYVNIFSFINKFYKKKKCKGRPTTDELEEFIGEIATMRKVGKHPNIVSLLGFCTVKQPLMMIMEYVGCGDLVSQRIIFKN